MKNYDSIADGSRQATRPDILEIVAEDTGVSIERMLSKCHKQETVIARDLAIHRIRVMTRAGRDSLPYIGRVFNRHHTSIMAAIDRQDEQFKNRTGKQPWDALSLNYLHRNYMTKTKADIAFNIGRTQTSVQHKITRLGLAGKIQEQNNPEPKQHIIKKYSRKEKQIIISQQMHSKQFENYASHKKLKTRHAMHMAGYKRAKQNGQATKAEHFLRAARLAAQELGKLTKGRIVL